ncbi:MAG: cytochrome ubiquinol oxidase subunit I [Pseudonocardiales bacterium]|nr:cytochrome ubiquinol oxidase subunit I [Pseudonocardiales bacterium]MBV9031773.1 cytochrome ubiquinol oxidase subunit I [Pseudonocardiales bacterium]
MSRYGQVIGLPFALEGIAFLIEAIFLGVYLGAWDRLPPCRHLLSGIPIVVAGVCSAFFVVTRPQPPRLAAIVTLPAGRGP